MRPAIVGIAGVTLAPEEAALFRRVPPAGIILFARNIADPVGLRGLIASVRGVLPEGALLMVDQEGGRVARLRPPHWRDHPPAAEIGALHARDEEAGLRAAFLTGALIGADCAAAGFDVVAAPVLDRVVPGAHAVIGDRAYAADQETVAALGRAMADGLRAAGVVPVAKHAPGHGRAGADSHLALPVLPDVDPADLVPFARNADLPCMMTAHIRYEAVDDAEPATLSPAVIARFIRGIGFDGLLLTDDLAMQALTGPASARARAALDAGCDVALHCSGVLSETADVLSALAPMPAATTRRIAAARAWAASGHLPRDTAALAAERAALLA